MRAVPARLIQCDKLQRFNVDDQRQLSLARLGEALRAFHESHVCIGIQKEPVAGWLLAETHNGPAGT